MQSSEESAGEVENVIGDVVESVKTGVRDLSKFPACMNDEDCTKVPKEGGEYKCFQYMCYPWSTTPKPFRSCRRKSDCLSLQEHEGGDGSDGDCYRKLTNIAN